MIKIKNRSLLTQFRITIILIVMVSIVTSLFTYICFAMIFKYALNNNVIYPPNYYEELIPKIQAFVFENKSGILSPSCEKHLKNKVKGDGFYFQVVDYEGRILYGTYEKKLFETKEQLLLNLNKKLNVDKSYVHVIPVIDDGGKIKGAVSLIYKLNLSSVNKDKAWLDVVLFIVLFSPIIFAVVFTLLFSRIFSKKITTPLKLLMEGARQIKNKNLNFEIPYNSNNELGELCAAFLEMKEELNKSLSTQWKLEQERVEMVEALAHDLKSPLSIMKAYTEALIDDTNADEEQCGYLTVIEKNIEKSVSLVQQMQYVSDLDNFSIGLQPVPIDLSKFLQKKVCDYEIQGKQKEITFTLNIQDNFPTPIMIDIEKLERILDNIVSNSLQYTPVNGQIKIVVKEEKNTIFYEISDSGMGFSGKDIAKVFNKFYRGDEARQTKDGHSGLGLYIVKQLTELLRGSVKIENSKSGGACVVFWHSV